MKIEKINNPKACQYRPLTRCEWEEYLLTLHPYSYAMTHTTIGDMAICLICGEIIHHATFRMHVYHRSKAELWNERVYNTTPNNPHIDYYLQNTRIVIDSNGVKKRAWTNICYPLN